MAEKFRDVQLKNVWGYTTKNFKFGKIPYYFRTGFNSYANKYVRGKNAGLVPFIHFVGLSMLIFYAVDYNSHFKHEKYRRYH